MSGLTLTLNASEVNSLRRLLYETITVSPHDNDNPAIKVLKGIDAKIPELTVEDINAPENANLAELEQEVYNALDVYCAMKMESLGNIALDRILHRIYDKDYNHESVIREISHLDCMCAFVDIRIQNPKKNNLEARLKRFVEDYPQFAAAVLK